VAVGVTGRIRIIRVRAELAAIVPLLVIEPRRIGGERIRGTEKGTGYFFLRRCPCFAYRAAPMPRIPRGQVAGHAYHVLNRGNGGTAVFHKDGDYTAFLDWLATAKAKYPVKVFGFCHRPNHFHLAVQPATDAALSPFMQWWMTSHVRRYHRHYRSHGHVWQGRFKCFPNEAPRSKLRGITELNFEDSSEAEANPVASYGEYSSSTVLPPSLILSSGMGDD